MFRNESWKPIYFWSKEVKGQGHKSQQTVPAWVFALLWVLACSSWSGWQEGQTAALKTCTTYKKRF